MVFLPRQQEGSAIISELDELGIDEVSLTNWDLHRDLTLVQFVTVRTAGEEELAVDLVRILFEPLL
jgi:hypothetical protein